MNVMKFNKGNIRLLSFLILIVFLSNHVNAQEEVFKGLGKHSTDKESEVKPANKMVGDTTKKPVGDLFKDLEEQNKDDLKNKTDIVKSIFKTTRLINGHSIENVAKGVLDVRISHRFGLLTDGAYGLWGLDAALMRMGVDYGINDRLMVGIGRSEYQKTFDGFVKYRLLRQSTGKVNMPVSVSLMSSMQWQT